VVHDETETGPFNSKNVLLNCVSHARNDMGKFANLRNLFAWKRCIPSRGHTIYMGDQCLGFNDIFDVDHI
jgi:hypothetical protein